MSYGENISRVLRFQGNFPRENLGSWTNVTFSCSLFLSAATHERNDKREAINFRDNKFSLNIHQNFHVLGWVKKWCLVNFNIFNHTFVIKSRVKIYKVSQNYVRIMRRILWSPFKILNCAVTTPHAIITQRPITISVWREDENVKIIFLWKSFIFVSYFDTRQMGCLHITCRFCSWKIIKQAISEEKSAAVKWFGENKSRANSQNSNETWWMAIFTEWFSLALVASQQSLKVTVALTYHHRDFLLLSFDLMCN